MPKKSCSSSYRNRRQSVADYVYNAYVKKYEYLYRVSPMGDMIGICILTMKEESLDEIEKRFPTVSTPKSKKNVDTTRDYLL